MSCKLFYLVLLYLAAVGYCQNITSTTYRTISKSELVCRAQGNCAQNVNRCPANEECVLNNLCIASRLNLRETIAELNKNNTRDACKAGETCCDISDIVRSKDENHCPAGQKCTSSSICTEERISLSELLKKHKINNTVVVTEKPSVCPINEVCCDIIDIDRIRDENHCPAGQKCTASSICTEERIGLSELLKKHKINNTVVVTEKPSVCPNNEVCCDIENAKLPSKCGLRNINGIGLGRKQNIREAEFAEFPWTLVVLKKEVFGDETSSIYLASGSLIHPSVALTSAHSIHGKIASQLQIRAGDWNLNTTNELYSHEELDVESIAIHEQFSVTNLRNDVALLFLQGEIELKNHINVICLPPQGYKFDYSHCFASGWGKDKIEEDGKYQVEMQKNELAIVPNDMCQTKLRQTRLGARYRLHDSFVCAGGEEVDLCIGSAGSPLVCPIEGSNGNYYQAGISSWGIGCGSIGVPGVYGNVSHFKDWIDQNMITKGFSTESYTY